MKKILIFVLLLTLLSLTQTTVVAEASHKTSTRTYEEWPNGIVEVGEEVQWQIEIVLVNLEKDDFTNVVVEDELPVELEIDYIDNMTHGAVSYNTTGTSEVHLTWTVGTLSYLEEARLVFYVSTNENAEGKHEYTTPGEYILNSNSTMNYFVYGKNHSYPLELYNLMFNVSPRVIDDNNSRTVSTLPSWGLDLSFFVIISLFIYLVVTLLRSKIF